MARYAAANAAAAGWLAIGLVLVLATAQAWPGARADPLDDLINYALKESAPSKTKTVKERKGWPLRSEDSIALDRLAEMTDMYGHRISGSTALEQSIDWIVEQLRKDNLSAVYTEPVQVPRWVRGEEFAAMVTPRPLNLPMLGLGMSIGTPASGITAEVMVVESFEELDQRAAEVSGKIVLYNAPWVSYGSNGKFRREGAVRAAQYGAVASLTRSIAPFSLSTPHTGSMDTASIPGAAITHEDADMIARIISRGVNVTIKLYMEAQFLPDVTSRNIIAEVQGTSLPNELVVMGGHIDSWDVGAGVLDDAGGAFVAWEALRLMAKYNIRPKRTVRVVFWTNEENGARGAQQYRDNRDDELTTTSFALESDSGIFSYGSTAGAQNLEQHILVDSTNEAYNTMVNIGARYLGPIGAGNVTRGGGGVDIQPLCNEGIPCAGLTVSTGAREGKEDSYFFYHHTWTIVTITPCDVERGIGGFGA